MNTFSSTFCLICRTKLESFILNLNELCGGGGGSGSGSGGEKAYGGDVDGSGDEALPAETAFVTD